MTELDMIRVTPIYHGKRNFLGKKDLVVSLDTGRCGYGKCTMCAIPGRSSRNAIPESEINGQIDWIFGNYGNEIDTFEQFSAGNEGSMLDERTFPRGSMRHLIGMANYMMGAGVLSLETRAEYIDAEGLGYIRNQFEGEVVDVAVGFESQDDSIRNTILRKGLPKELFESKVSVLGDVGIRLTSYVMLKPSPHMTENEGIREAEETITYLAGLTERNGVDLVIYLNPTYIAEGAPIARVMHEEGYEPPRISSARCVAQWCSKLGIPAYVGLWSEGLAEPGGSYDTSHPIERRARGTLRAFNKTQDPRAVYSTLTL